MTEKQKLHPFLFISAHLVHVTFDHVYILLMTMNFGLHFKARGDGKHWLLALWYTCILSMYIYIFSPKLVRERINVLGAAHTREPGSFHHWRPSVVYSRSRHTTGSLVMRNWLYLEIFFFFLSLLLSTRRRDLAPNLICDALLQELDGKTEWNV